MYRGRLQGQPVESKRAKTIAYVAKLSTHCKDPNTINSRIYVGNIHRLKAGRADIYNVFSKYGQIKAISNFASRNDSDQLGFAFVQFAEPSVAEAAVMSENGREFSGHTLDVKLAEFRIPNAHILPAQYVAPTPQSRPEVNVNLSHRGKQPDYLMPKQQVRPQNVVKRASTSPAEYAPTWSKRSKIESNSEPKSDKGADRDILVCGVCHVSFNRVEDIVYHKRQNLCHPKANCNCKEEGRPEVVTCGACYKTFSSPWVLIRHLHAAHDLKVCADLMADNNGAQNSAEGTEDLSGGHENSSGDYTNLVSVKEEAEHDECYSINFETDLLEDDD